MITREPVPETSVREGNLIKSDGCEITEDHVAKTTQRVFLNSR